MHQKFAERLAKIYLELKQTVGVDYANEWADRTVPPECTGQVTSELRRIKSRLPRPDPNAPKPA